MRASEIQVDDLIWAEVPRCEEGHSTLIGSDYCEGRVQRLEDWVKVVSVVKMPWGVVLVGDQPHSLAQVASDEEIEVVRR